MDAKITLAFNKEVIEKAKDFAELNNISLSRLTEYLYTQITSKNYKSLEELPVSDWINEVSVGPMEYKKLPGRNDLKNEFF
ncbi:DUF6364 family protein [Algoriphagus boritolerans]